MTDQTIYLHTDGACRGNPGHGAWAAILRFGTQEKSISGTEDHTTNNRMELQAAIEGLQAIKKHAQVHLTTDSQYVKNGITQWIKGWKARGWRTSQKKAVKNQDLWETLDQQVQRHDVTWHWVRGHSGDQYNERVDALCNHALDAWESQQ